MKTDKKKAYPPVAAQMAGFECQVMRPLPSPGVKGSGIATAVVETEVGPLITIAIHHNVHGGLAAILAWEDALEVVSLIKRHETRFAAIVQ